MQLMTTHHRQLGCILLAILMAGLALAVVSPLHKHDLRTHKCSLNNIEGLQADGPAVVLELPDLADLGLNARVDRPGQLPERQLLPATGRAPPSHFS